MGSLRFRWLTLVAAPQNEALAVAKASVENNSEEKKISAEIKVRVRSAPGGAVRAKRWQRARPGSGLTRRPGGLAQRHFDQKYGPTWHCIAGSDFKAYVTHESKSFIFFYVGKQAILLYKAG